MADLKWGSYFVEPNTPYIDEPSETVPVGWYVRCHDVEDSDPETRCRAEVFVEWAIDEAGEDVTEALASRIAALLNAGAA